MNPLALHAARIPDHSALIDGEKRWSWGRLHDEARAAAVLLQREHGIRPGDIIATLLGNTAEHVILLHAILLSGATAAPLNTRLVPVERARQLAHLDPRLLVSTDAPELTGITTEHPDALLAHESNVRCEEFRPIVNDDGRFCSILYTSGTAGVMKAVPHTWANHRASAEGSAANLGVREDDNWLCVIPLYHIGGFAIVMRSLFYGTTVTMQQASEPLAMLSTMRRENISLLSIVPTVLQRMFEADHTMSGGTIPALRAILLGGAPASPVLWTEALARDLPVLGTYGLTETCSQVVTASPGSWRSVAGSAGRPIGGAELRIMDESGGALQPGMLGEIVVRGAMVTEGYLRNEATTAARFRDDWFHTGDIGMIDTGGLLHVLGRRDDMIVTGGENVHPSEIEDILVRHPGVRDAAVTGIADPVWGSKIAAVLVLSTAVSEGELDAWCRRELAGYKIPRVWRQVDALPRTASGKVIRSEVSKIAGGV